MNDPSIKSTRLGTRQRALPRAKQTGSPTEFAVDLTVDLSFHLAEHQPDDLADYESDFGPDSVIAHRFTIVIPKPLTDGFTVHEPVQLTDLGVANDIPNDIAELVSICGRCDS